MVSKMEACAECSRSCLSLHRMKLDPHPMVSSFFKVMFGKHFSEMLIIPPKFARTVMAMEGRSTYLEDPTGQKWKVDLSNVKGSLAFQKGWHEFLVDHGIELGDFLAFHYFKGSHFFVQIFGRSGCEKPMIFSDKNYQNKRAKLITDSIPRSPIDSSCNDSPAKKCLNFCMDSVPDADVNQRKGYVKNAEKLPEISVDNPREGKTNKRPRDISADFLLESFMTNRNTSFSREEDHRDYLFDLSTFEMPEKKVDAVQTQTEVASLDVVKCQMDKDFEISNEADWLRIIKLPNNNISEVDIPLNISPPLKHITLPHNSEVSAPASSCQLPRGRIIKQEPKTGETVCDNATNSLQKVKNNSFGWQSTSVIEDQGHRDMIISPEALDVCDSPPALAIKITCSVQHNSESFLELTKPLPVDVWKQGNVELEQNLVLLRDPAGRLWPVIYHQRKDFKGLASGWNEFRKSNGIQPGDKCTFIVENIDEGIVQVHIDSQFSWSH